jgi:hypothetical protein
MILPTKQEYKKYLTIIAIITILILIEWIINPPFYKDKEITITDIEKVVTQDFYKNREVDYNIYFRYNLDDGTQKQSLYKTDKYPLPNVGDKTIKNVRVTPSEGSFSPDGHILILVVLLSLLWIATFLLLKLFQIMTIRYYLYLFVSAIFSFSFYIWYTLSTPPLLESYLERYRVVRFFNALDYRYHDDISNYTYVMLAHNYREDIESYYKPLTKKEQQLIWENYIKIYRLLNSVSLELMVHKEERYYYNFKARSYSVASHFTKLFDAIGLCETIEVDFTTQPKLDLDIKDKNRYELIKRNFQEAYRLLEINRSFKKD